jgi:hypothetical protein
LILENTAALTRHAIHPLSLHRLFVIGTAKKVTVAEWVEVMFEIVQVPPTKVPSNTVSPQSGLRNTVNNGNISICSTNLTQIALQFSNSRKTKGKIRM